MKVSRPETAAPQRSQADAISQQVAARALGALAVLIPLHYWSDLALGNRWSPIALFVICIASLFELRRINLGQVILMPIAWFFLACAVYYGLGPLLYIYGNDFTIASVDAYYYVDGYALWRTNLLNLTSIALILLFFCLVARASFFRPFKTSGDEATLKKAAYFFSALGIGFTMLTHGLRLHYGPEFVMPGVFFTLAQCALAGVFLYSLLFFRRSKNVVIPLLLVAIFTGFFAVTSLMKRNILEWAMMPFLGFFLARPSMKKLVVSFLIVVGTFPILTRLTTYGRILIWTDVSYQATGGDLLRAFADKEAISKLDEVNEDDQGVWRRICYVSAQAFAMDAYDAGKTGDSFGSALWALVPRVIYPDKPVITQGGTFTTLVKGSEIGGASGPGFFGEAYWNYGWLGVLLMGFIAGSLLAGYSQFNADMVLSGNFQFFPAAFMALTIGYRVDDWFASSTFNSIPLMITVYLLSMLLSREGYAARQALSAA